jgi:sugar phosphate isomerase/epimerase
MTDFSYQLYSSRNFPPLSDTLKMLARLGYKQVEGYGALYADDAAVEELKRGLAENGLKMPTGHFALDMLESEPRKALGIAEALGIETLYCPYLPAEQRPDTGAGWLDFGKRLAAAGARYRDAGLGFGWHNHDFEFRPLPDGSLPIVAIFEGGPDLEWEADIAWVVRGGADPFEWIKTFGERITAVHVKDIGEGKNEEDGWADVGDGTMDWKGLMTALEGTPVKVFVMEHDNPSDAARFAERSLAAARRF